MYIPVILTLWLNLDQYVHCPSQLTWAPSLRTHSCNQELFSAYYVSNTWNTWDTASNNTDVPSFMELAYYQKDENKLAYK